MYNLSYRINFVKRIYGEKTIDVCIFDCTLLAKPPFRNSSKYLKMIKRCDIIYALWNRER
jgi:hypothetical protein